MASGIFALLDDIAALMDDVVVMSKVTTKKTAGILGDDLAVNAEKASGFVSSRELPVLWAITKGSFLNKVIILPIAFLLSAYLPWMVTLILILGGLYLAYEGAEKIYEYVVPHQHKDETKATLAEAPSEALEQAKIKSAIVTDFILSVEIIIIALGAVMDQTLTVQILVVTIVALIATVGVYGIVALIVRMDDLGLVLVTSSKGRKTFGYHLGQGLIKALPIVVKSLSVIGTIALLLVAGGIFVHNIAFLHHVMEQWPSLIRDFLIGLVVGIAVLILVTGFKKLLKLVKP
ncbi:membrane protein [Mangrovimonas yunxiaonensis]|uniref:Membrane protein n=1 Tax=Mangrovimonas yunxiaonensis TaxID=1197477 RepID=A0A084TJ73_9FLAO|nr:DUF808 domain-containing protein [Mangrovimonas yunxiaonensis]KFB00759.1 membrane protein [Mangrovimonas yunxiaonensis]GGH45870.1 membrane protein [Mangrovimonas yunxiaonensis]